MNFAATATLFMSTRDALYPKEDTVSDTASCLQPREWLLNL